MGSIYVARTMRSLLDRGNNVIFGGEGNGGLIFPDHQFCRDGGMTAAMMVSILSTGNLPLSCLLKELPQRHMIKEKIYSHDGENILKSLRFAFSKDVLDHTDGLKILREDCWALIRIFRNRTTNSHYY